MKIALIGATGMVGGVVLEVLKERNLLFNELFLVASKSSYDIALSFFLNFFDKDHLQLVISLLFFLQVVRLL